MCCRIFYGHFPEQCSHRFFRQNTVFDPNMKLQIGNLLLNCQRVHADMHPLRLCLLCKCFLCLFFFAQKSTKSCTFYVLISFVRRFKFHNRMIFIFHTKTCHALSAVDVITPDRNAMQPRDTRKETGKHRFCSIIFDRIYLFHLSALLSASVR
jgi:hypothetical protein